MHTCEIVVDDVVELVNAMHVSCANYVEYFMLNTNEGMCRLWRALFCTAIVNLATAHTHTFAHLLFESINRRKRERETQQHHIHIGKLNTSY